MPIINIYYFYNPIKDKSVQIPLLLFIPLIIKLFIYYYLNLTIYK